MQPGQRIAYELAATCDFKEVKGRFNQSLLRNSTGESLSILENAWRFMGDSRGITREGNYTQAGLTELAGLLGHEKSNTDDLLAMIEVQMVPQSKGAHMAKQKDFTNQIDAYLDHGYSDAEMNDAEKRGNELSGLTRDMAEDGFFTSHLAASNESVRTHISKKLSDDNILNDVTVSENKAKSNKDGLASKANESALLSAIDKLLDNGVPPAKIARAIAKCAELNVTNRQMGTEYLNNRANDLGMGYLQPNAYMPKQPQTYENERPKMAGNENVKEHAKTCPQCSKAVYQAEGRLCPEGLRVGNEVPDPRPYAPMTTNDLKPREFDGHGMASVHIAVEGDDILSLGSSKFGGQATTQKRAIEIKIADRVEGKNNLPTIGRVPNPLNVRTAKDAVKTAASHHRGEEFDAGLIASQHLAGKTFEQIWNEACKEAGLHLASRVFHEYIATAKRKGTKFASKEAAFLRDKLGFKDIEVAPIKEGLPPRMAYDSGKHGGKAPDGNELLKEFDLTASTPLNDVEMNKETSMEIESGKFSIGDII